MPDESLALPVPTLPFELEKEITSAKYYFDEFAIKGFVPPVVQNVAAAQSYFSKALSYTGLALYGVGGAAYYVLWAPVSLVTGTARLTAGAVSSLNSWVRKAGRCISKCTGSSITCSNI